jgi:hypothetical protein
MKMKLNMWLFAASALWCIAIASTSTLVYVIVEY